MICVREIPNYLENKPTNKNLCTIIQQLRCSIGVVYVFYSSMKKLISHAAFNLVEYDFCLWQPPVKQLLRHHA